MLIGIKILGLLVGLSLIGGVIGTGISLWSIERKRKQKEQKKNKD